MKITKSMWKMNDDVACLLGKKKLICPVSSWTVYDYLKERQDLKLINSYL